MRWDKLFDDLESQLERELTAEEVDLAAEDERLRLGRLTLRDRMLALNRGGDGGIRLLLADGSRHTVRPDSFGRDWCSGVLDGARSRQCVVPLAGIAGISLDEESVRPSLTDPADPERAPGLSSRLSLPFVLRDLCRRRRDVDLDTIDGTLHGTIDRVGRDHVDVALHDPGTARRRGNVRELRLVPLSRLVLVRL
jgi:hypothetical protein